MKADRKVYFYNSRTSSILEKEEGQGRKEEVCGVGAAAVDASSLCSALDFNPLSATAVMRLSDQGPRLEMLEKQFIKFFGRTGSLWCRFQSDESIVD